MIHYTFLIMVKKVSKILWFSIILFTFAKDWDRYGVINLPKRLATLPCPFLNLNVAQIKNVAVMKVNYYRNLLRWDGDITPTDRIVYDFLLTKSISVCSDVYDKDGIGIDMDALTDYLKDSGNKLDIYSISYRKLADELGVSLASVYNSIKHLKELRLVGADWVCCQPSIPCNGYFALRMDLKHEISGKLLVFYSWLCDRAKNGIVDAYRNIMAKYFNDKESNIHNMLQRLHNLKFIEREVKGIGEYGKLKLLK